MKIKSSTLRLLNEEDKVLCSLRAEIHFNENNPFDEGDLFFRHRMNGTKCERVEQSLYGTSEFIKKEENYWYILKDKILDDTELKQKIWDDLKEIDYFI